MSTTVTHDSANHVLVGTAGALGAVTLLWSGGLNSTFFQAGTVLLVISLIPLARGLGARAGTLIGLMLSVVWIAARLGFSRTLDMSLVVCEVNIIIIAAMTTIGGLAGILLHSRDSSQQAGGLAISPSAELPSPVDTKANSDQHTVSSAEMETKWRKAMLRHREWMMGWDQASYPWTSFDSHIRELIRSLTDLQRLRCYRISQQGQLFPLSNEQQKDSSDAPADPLFDHVVTTGRRFDAGSSAAGPLIKELVQSGGTPMVWAIPIRDRHASIGLITAEAMGRPIGEAQLQAVADFAEELWLHVHHLDLLRLARQTDRGSGLINRTDFLSSLKASLDECYKAHEPVVLMVVCLEGLRGLDDASHWAKRDELIEAVGQTISNGIRKDDMVGRFSDAQFVALLRRLDIPLAELISRKLLGSIAKVISDFGLTTWITPRAGLTGSGFAKPDAEALLRHAISALQKARGQDLLLISESQDKS